MNLKQIKKKAIENHVPIIMDDALETIEEYVKIEKLIEY